MLVDLVQTTTADGVRLDGAYQAPPRPGAAGLNVDAFMLIHGTGGNFYSSTLFDALADRLLALGVGVLRANTRGHDLMCTAMTTRGGRRLGAAYEVVDDARHDLAAWRDWLKQHAGPRVGLLGHSLGAVKCLYAQASGADAAVTCLAAISPPRLSYSFFAADEKGAEFLETYHRAKALVEAGEPNALLDFRLPMPFVVTAAGYVEKYGPDERYNYLGFIGRVGCPTLLTLGEVESAQNMAFRGAAEAVRAAAPAVRVEMVAGADHFYSGVRDRLTDCVEDWLRREIRAVKV
jgi:alpha-beta hydrolase superfamily lysophospholipase